MQTGIVSDKRYLLHQPGVNHPESPARVSSILNKLKSVPWFARLKKYAPQKLDLRWCENVHARSYIDRAREACLLDRKILDTEDVGISKDSYDIASLAAGGCLELADRILAGDIDNGFVLARPPGHHAEYDQAMGFCILNNTAICAKYLQARHGLERIMILDWDVHHGNGTQHIFEKDPSVFYISLHQYPFYPGTGAASETGHGKGKGATLNVPMKAFARDEHYKEAFRRQVIPAARAFKPDAIIISAGFDAHTQDPLGNICLTSDCFVWMTRQTLDIAAQYSGGRILSVLEGGYHLEALSECVIKHVATLADIKIVEALNESL